MYLNTIKTVREKLTASAILNGDQLEALPLKSGMNAAVLSPYSFSILCLKP